MDGCRALSLQSSELEGIEHFRNCRTVLQKIGFILDKWAESVRDIHPGVRRREVAVVESCLDETEKKLWKLFMHRMSSGTLAVGHNQINSGTDRPLDMVANYPISSQLGCIQREDRTTHHTPTINKQVVHVQKHVHVQNVAVKQAAQPIKNAISSPPELVNMMVDWYVSLVHNGLQLNGVLLNEGHWKTSPIATRVGPTTVKTVSGTTYNISGEMHIPGDEEIPEFVYQKFHNGFPNDWLEVIRQWRDFMSTQNRLVGQQNGGNMTKNDSPYFHNPVQFGSRADGNQVHQRMAENDRDQMPPPSQVLNKQKYAHSQTSSAPTRPSSVIERGPLQEARVKRRTSRSLSPSERRTSNRILMKSLTDISLDNSVDQDCSVVLNLLKKWGAEDTGNDELVLVGQLVSGKHQVIDRNFVSASISRRIQADLVETVDGEVYRLLGAPNPTGSNIFNHGFPMPWKNHLRKGNFPLRPPTNSRVPKKQGTLAAGGVSRMRQTNATHSERSVDGGPTVDKNSSRTSITSSLGDHKRQSQMIQHVMRQHLKMASKVQNSSKNKINNTTMIRNANESLQNKRKEPSQRATQNFAPLKRAKGDVGKAAGEAGILRSQNGHEVDLGAESEQNAKESQVRDLAITTARKMEAKASSKLSSQQQKNGAPQKPANKGKVNTTNKCLPGLSPVMGPGEFDFEMF